MTEYIGPDGFTVEFQGEGFGFPHAPMVGDGYLRRKDGKLALDDADAATGPTGATGPAGETGPPGATGSAGTTGGAAATFAANTSGLVDDSATFDGYTLGQVVKSLRDQGLLT